MLEKMPAAILTEWMGYYGIEPFGDVRADLRAGTQAALTVNSNPYRSGSAAHPADFYDTLHRGEKRQTAKQAAESARLWVQAINAQAKRNG